MQFRIKIAGVDVGNSVLADSIRITSIITKRIDTCFLKVADRAGLLMIKEKDEIIISNLAETIRYFGGYIADLIPGVDGVTKTFDCSCHDYTILVETVLVNEIYDGMTDKEIITALFAKYLPEVSTVDHVEVGLFNRRLIFNRITLREALNVLSGNSGFDWYIDYWKRIHYFSSLANPAPFGLSDTPDDILAFPYSDLIYQRDATQIINRILVIGGTYLSPDTTFELPGNGQTTELIMPFRMKKPSIATEILIWRNTGTDAAPIWTTQGVGVDFLEELGGAIDVLNNYFAKVLRFAVAPPNLLRAIKVTGRYDIPILVRARSDASFATYGRWFEDKKIDRLIDAREWAIMVGKGILAEHAFVKEKGSLICEQDGLFSGQSLPIKNVLRGIDGKYLINRLTTRIIGGTRCQYKIDFGEYNPDLIDLFLIVKARAVQWQPRREDETIIELLEQSETLSLGETTAFWTHSNAQYAWSPHVSNALRELLWGFGTWG